MIYLSDTMFIGCGSSRACFTHPDNPNLIIKVPIKNRKQGVLSNIKELKGYTALIRSHADLFCISHCHGFVYTNHGKGLICDCIRDDDGAISRSIWDIIIYKDDCSVDQIKKIANEFCDFLILNDIFLFDLNLKNIILKRRYNGDYEPFAIDLKGRCDNKELIPLANYFKYFSRKKLKRRSKQLIERISEFRKIREEKKILDTQRRKEVIGGTFFSGVAQ